MYKRSQSILFQRKFQSFEILLFIEALRLNSCTSSGIMMRFEGHAEYAAVSNINLVLFDYGWQLYVVNKLV